MGTTADFSQLRNAALLGSRHELAPRTVGPTLDAVATDAIPRPRRALRLRTRVTVFFSLASLIASLALAVVTYAVARTYLLDQRTSVAQSQAFGNANAIRNELRAATSDDLTAFIAQLPEPAGFAVLLMPDGGRFAPDVRYTEDVLPGDLVSNVGAGRYGQQAFAALGAPFLGAGVYIAEFDALYFEAFPMSSTERTLQAIATALAVGAAVTALIAAGIGWWASRRLLNPLSRVATAAGTIASGGLDARMQTETDPDLARLARSFNDMADAVQARIEREARFASDVSHELRSPITALSAAVEVLDARRGDLPERSQQALDVVVTQVRRFDQMVMDLLELSRIDAGSTELHREEVGIEHLVSRIAHRYGFGEVPIEVKPNVPETVVVDKLRFERVLANLLDNANQHGGGPTRVIVTAHGSRGIALAVEDSGPGVARGERARIFERFARGSAARHKIGTGLGLSLVAEHAHAHGGEAWVEDRAGGGARFVVTFEEAY
ncbi:MAG: two-component histidine kinase MtrB [Actinomycetota bacterium]|jgi:signal transduction histidine kinase